MSDHRGRLLSRRVAMLLLAIGLTACVFTQRSLAEEVDDERRTIVLIGAEPDGHPPSTHEYARSVLLFKHALEASPNLESEAFRVVAFPHGWPEDEGGEAALDEADTLVFITSGSDHVETNQPMFVGDRMDQLERHMARGCGIVTIHYSTFAPMRVSEKILDWVGGHFDYESNRGDDPPWYSAIQHYEAPVALPKPEHPIARGVSPFTVNEEFYYRIRFREDDDRFTPILHSQPPGEQQPQTVAWAIEREDGGRGFGLTGGHHYHNWFIRDYRRLALNAIVWSAGLEVPREGVVDPVGDEPTRVLILTGHHHPGHDWPTLTEALQQVIEDDPRTQVDVWEEIENLATQPLDDYDVLVMNYNNWDRDGLSEAARTNFRHYLADGGGLSVIHFANGAFHHSLPNAESDWPEYRRMVRRVWDHTADSGHDAHGPFTVEIAGVEHPITADMEDFETVDELYFNQVGSEPITPLATARSKVTDRDEPMAWAYDYHEGRVFQTVLGHDAPAVRDAGALIRRGTLWAAREEQLGFEPSDYRPATVGADGQFGPALDARRNTARVAADDELTQLPLTIEAWARLDSAASFNIIVSSENKQSATHWELYSYAGDGTLAFYLPGYEPAEIRSEAVVADGQWHHVGVSFDDDLVRLYVDGEQVAEQAVSRRAGGERLPGPLMIGYTRDGEQRIGCLGSIEQVRLRRGAHPIAQPEGLMEVDDHTLGLWRFDQVDAGRASNAAGDAHPAAIE